MEPEGLSGSGRRPLDRADNVVPLPMEDGERVRRLSAQMRDGEEAAFREFYESYCDRLYRYLLLLTRGNELLARDLLQATMIKAMRAMREFATERHLWNWLAAIARNNFVDALRRAQANPQVVPLLPEEALTLPTKSIEEHERALLNALDRCLAELAPQDRALLEAFYFEDGSHESVAEQQNTTPKAIESKLARLRQKLRASLLRRLRYEND